MKDSSIQLNLCKMLGLADSVFCPMCCTEVLSSFYAFSYEDVEEANPEQGEWIFKLYCGHCKHAWEYHVQIRANIQEI